MFPSLQVSHFGCKSFALLFDDIDHNMCPADKEVFSSFAHAQVSITNEIFQYLGEPDTFLFCPTGKGLHIQVEMLSKKHSLNLTRVVLEVGIILSEGRYYTF